MLSLLLTLLTLLLLTTFGLVVIRIENSFWPVAVHAEEYGGELENVGEVVGVYHGDCRASV